MKLHSIKFEWVNNKQVCSGVNENGDIVFVNDNISRYLFEGDSIEMFKDTTKIIYRQLAIKYVIVKGIKNGELKSIPILNPLNTQKSIKKYFLYCPFERKAHSIVISGVDCNIGDRFIIELKDDLYTIKSKISSIKDAQHDDYLFKLYYKLSIDEDKESITNTFNLVYNQSENKSKSEIVNQCDLNTFYIDPSNSQDHDDAISIKFNKDGSVTFYIHIVDIVYYTKNNKELDLNAFLLNQTLYFKNNENLNIYPEDKSCGEFSLNVNEKKRVITTEITFLDNRIINKKIYSSEIIVKNGYDYSVELFYTNKLLYNFVEALKFPSLNIYNVDYEIDSSNKITLKRNKKNDIVHFNCKFIELLMILNNCIIIEHLNKSSRISPERVHLKPITTNNFDTEIDEEFKDILEVKRYMNAYYCEQEKVDIGHFGLKLKNYTHFTSPIRRYFDTIIHKIISGSCDSENLKVLVNYCNKRQKLNKSIQKYMEKIYKWRFIEQNKNDRDAAKSRGDYTGVILKCSKTGINVLVKEVALEIQIHISKLSKETLCYNDNCLGNKTIVYKIGDDVKLNNPHTNFIDVWSFELVN